MNQAEDRFLCRLDELADPGSRGFRRREGSVGAELFLVRQGDAVHAYRNRCPHTGAPLEWTPNQFLDAEGRLIQCALHGALFAPESGLCLQGPCAGRRLEPVPIQVADGRVLLAGD